LVGPTAEAGARPVTTLVMSGPVTLAESPRWREALLATLAEGHDVRLDLATAGPWDLAGLQLLLAALASGRRSGQAVRLARVPRVCLAVADRAGLAGHLAGTIESRME
jgi:ABC-type transporter Mla MlaB component